MDYRDRLTFFFWVKTHADAATEMAQVQSDPNAGLAEFARDCMKTGRAMALMDLAKEILEPKFAIEMEEAAKRVELELNQLK